MDSLPYKKSDVLALDSASELHYNLILFCRLAAAPLASRIKVYNAPIGPTRDEFINPSVVATALQSTSVDLTTECHA